MKLEKYVCYEKKKELALGHICIFTQRKCCEVREHCLKWTKKGKQIFKFKTAEAKNKTKKKDKNPCLTERAHLKTSSIWLIR